MAVSSIGYKITGNAQAIVNVPAGVQIAYVPDPIGSAAIIFYEMGALLGRAGATAGVSRYGIGRVNTPGNPDDLLSYTTYFQPTTAMTGPTGGAIVLKDLGSPVLGQSGLQYALVLANISQATTLGAIQKSVYTGRVNYDYYTKANLTSIPTNPIGGTVPTEGNEFGHLALWATGEVNVAPNTPTSITPSGTIVSTDTTPVITANFADDNETLPNGKSFDELRGVRVQVRRLSDQVLFWNYQYEASDAETAARQSSIEYAGTALAAGVDYQVRVGHRDIAGSWSPWSDWTSFIINAGGTVVPLTPSGKQNGQTPAFTGSWSHPNPLNANAAIVRILDDAGNVVQTMSKSSPYTLSPTVASGGTITVPWANTGFTTLTRGKSYAAQMMARDTASAWGNSDRWSSSVSFTINATPGVPVVTSPANAQTYGYAPPTIEVSASDKDDATSGLTVTLEILRHDGTSVQRVMTYNATKNRFQYTPVVSTDERQLITRAGTITSGSFTITVPANWKGGPFTTAAIQWNDTAATIQTRLEALANVGAGNVFVSGGPVSTTNVTINFFNELGGKDLAQITVTSSLVGGGTITPSTTQAGVAQDYVQVTTTVVDWQQPIQFRAKAGDGTSESAWSAYKTMTVRKVPQVTLTNPADTDVVTTSTYRVQWVVNAGGPQVKYRVYVVAIDGSGVPLPSVYLVDTGDVVSTNAFHDLANLRNNYSYQIFVEVVDGTGLRGQGGTPNIFTVTFTPPEAVTGFVAGSSALQASTGGDAIRLGWDASLRPNSDFRWYDIYRISLAETAETRVPVLLRRITEIGQTTWIDPFPASGVIYEYTLYQTIRIGLDDVQSIAATANGSVDIHNVVLKSVLEPESYGIELRYKSGSAGFMASRRNIDAKKIRPVAGKLGRTVRSQYRAWEDTGAFEIVSDRFGSATDRIAKFEALDENADTICLQTFDGLRRFVTIDEVGFDRFSTEHVVLTLKVSEEYYREGEA